MRRIQKVHLAPDGERNKMAAAGSRGEAFRQKAQGKERVPARRLVGIKAKPVPALSGGMENAGKEKGGPCFHNKLLQ